MPGEDRSAEAIRPELESLRVGLFAIGLSVALTALMLAARTGLPTPPLAVVVGPAILAATILPPLLWARLAWVGPFALLALGIACGLSALGTIGLVLVWGVALASAAIAIARVARAGTGISGLWAWVLLLIAAALLAALLIHGSKYTNLVADQLLLYGRTDGDMMFHSAIANAFRYFHFPSTGIDGLQPLHYHTGIDFVTALIAAGTDLPALLALVVLRAQILFPLAFFTCAWAAQVFASVTVPDRRVGGPALAIGTLIVLLLMPSGNFDGFAVQNDPMFLSGTLLLLVAPAIFAVVAPGAELRAGNATAWVLAIVVVPILGFMKISTGYFWCGLAGFWLLRRVGPLNWRFWAVGAGIAVLFIASYLALTNPSAVGAKLFGAPFYVTRGFREGNPLLPLQIHAVLLAAILGLLLWRRDASHPTNRFLIESLLVAGAVANLPGLLMDIPGGDAVFFILVANWFAAPVLVGLIALLPQRLRTATPRHRKIGGLVSAVLLLALLINAGIRTDDRAFVVISGAALLHTGDATYYARDKSGAWHADTRRALEEHGLAGLYALPAPVPVAAGLAGALQAFKREAGAAGAAYIPPQSDFWPLISDCDGRSLWPMAVSGVPLIDGTVPVQSACVQTFALNGYPPPPERRTDLDDAALCQRAKALGFNSVLRLDSLADRSKDRRIDCR